MVDCDIGNKVCNNDISNYSFITCSSCSSNTHIVCLHDAKSIKNKFPDGNVAPKYVYDILCFSFVQMQLPPHQKLIYIVLIITYQYLIH